MPVNIHIKETANELEIKTVPPCLQMPKNSPNQTITFNLRSTDYRFVTNIAEAIKFKNPGNQMGAPKPGPGPDSIVVEDKNSDTDYYEYTIKVEHKVTGKVLIIDPLIKNN